MLSPTTKAQKNTDRRLQKNWADRFMLGWAVFVISATVSYVLAGLASLNLPRYYPQLHSWSTVAMDGEIAMGLFGRFAWALVVGLVVALLYLLFSRGISQLRKKVPAIFWASATAVTLSFGSAVIVVEEWHKWGLEKRGLEQGGLFNAELGLFLVGLAVFILGIGLLMLAWRRVASYAER